MSTFVTLTFCVWHGQKSIQLIKCCSALDACPKLVGFWSHITCLCSAHFKQILLHQKEVHMVCSHVWWPTPGCWTRLWQEGFIKKHSWIGLTCCLSNWKCWAHQSFLKLGSSKTQVRQWKGSCEASWHIKHCETSVTMRSNFDWCSDNPSLQASLCCVPVCDILFVANKCPAQLRCPFWTDHQFWQPTGRHTNMWHAMRRQKSTWLLLQPHCDQACLCHSQLCHFSEKCVIVHLPGWRSVHLCLNFGMQEMFFHQRNQKLFAFGHKCCDLLFQQFWETKWWKPCPHWESYHLL